MNPITDRQIADFVRTLQGPLAGLSVRNLRTLHIIADHAGPLNRKDLGAILRVDTKGAATATKPLLERQLITQQQDPGQNGWPLVVATTDDGRALHARMLAACQPADIAS